MIKSKEQASKLGKKGSRKGVPNRSTQEIRQAFQLLVDQNLDRLQKDMEALKPVERLRMILDLSKFIIPTLKSVEQKTEIDVHTILALTPAQRQKRLEQLKNEISNE